VADPAYIVLWVLHHYLRREHSLWEDFRDPEFDGARITYTDVPSGRRYEIVARPVAESTDS
jgi:hypothetical protein